MIETILNNILDFAKTFALLFLCMKKMEKCFEKWSARDFYIKERQVSSQEKLSQAKLMEKENELQKLEFQVKIEQEKTKRKKIDLEISKKSEVKK